jgi:Clp amino terminal domain, pathogenicity island component
MFERFTDKARGTVFAARAKAAERGDGQIRPMYLLHGLITRDGVAARALAGLGLDAAAVDRQIARSAPAANPLEDGEANGDAEALASIGIDLDEIRRKIEENFGAGALARFPAARPGPLTLTGRITMTRESKQALGLALKEARALHHNYLGTEHLLLGLLTLAERNPRGEFTLASLRDLGLDATQTRERVLSELAAHTGTQPPGQ